MTRRRGWIALALGLLLGIVGAVLLVSRFASTFGADPIATPATIERELDAGTWVVMERVGTTAQAGAFSSTSRTSPQVTNVTVTDSGGSPIAVAGMGSVSQTLDINGRNYLGIATVDIPEDGAWTVSIDSDSASEVAIVPSLTEDLGQTLAGMALAGMGGLLAILGGVMLFVDWSRRRDEHTHQMSSPRPDAPAPPPPVPNSPLG